MICRTGGTYHVGSSQPCKLYGQRANSTCCCVNEDRIARPDAELLERDMRRLPRPRETARHLLR